MKLVALVLGALLAVGAATAAYGEPRGIRTNNPGNLVKTPTTWQGEVECSDTMNECFVDAYHGIRALAKVLHTYYHKYRLRTINDIMARFSEFDGAAWGVSQLSGIPQDAHLSFQDAGTVMNLVVAIIIQENGYNPYPKALIRQVLYDTYGDNYFRGVYPSVRTPKDLGEEAGHGAGAARPDDASPRRQHEGTEGDSADRRSGIQLDSQDNSVVVCICNHRSSEDGSTADAARSNNSWVDRISGWIAVFLSGRRGSSDLARSEGVCTYSP